MGLITAVPTQWVRRNWVFFFRMRQVDGLTPRSRRSRVNFYCSHVFFLNIFSFFFSVFVSHFFFSFFSPWLIACILDNYTFLLYKSVQTLCVYHVLCFFFLQDATMKTVETNVLGLYIYFLTSFFSWGFLIRRQRWTFCVNSCFWFFGRMRISDSSIKTVEINFLCVHKKLRAKRLAPVLIKEVTRRVNLMGVWQVPYRDYTNYTKI